jgi:hypothetical protein
VDRGLHHRLRPLTSQPRNPFRNEADAFRVLVMILGAAAIVIAAAVLIGPIAGVVAAIVLACIGGWRAWGLWQSWGESHRDASGD